MSETDTEEDSGGIFCQSCSPTTRKLGYFITFFIGLLIFGYGVLCLIWPDTGPAYTLLVGGYTILFCPLWIKSPRGCFADMKNALRISSALIFFALLVVNTVAIFVYLGGLLNKILGICLGIAGIWYFLSFFPNGQKSCIACLKACCSSSES